MFHDIADGEQQPAGALDFDMHIIRKPKDFCFGVIMLIIAGIVLIASSHYSIGTARQMGPGYFPVALSVILAVLAIILIGRSLAGELEPMEGFSLKPLLLVLGGSLLFGLLIRPAGLPIATIATVVVGSLANRQGRPIEVAALAFILATGSVLVFIYGLEQPIPILGYWFG